jgi:hypothetical protein
MNSLTKKHLHLNTHINHNGGTKTVCVSTCLSYLGIRPDSYNYTSSKTNYKAYQNVIRRNGYSLRSKMTEFKVKKARTTMTELKSNIRKSKYSDKDLFVVSGIQSNSAHLMILNGDGITVIDTAPNKRWKIRSVSIVETIVETK